MITVTIIQARNGRFVTAINEQPLVSTPTTNPMFGSCRALVALGYADGPVQFVHAGSAIIAVRIRSIHGGAKLRVEETDRNGLRIVAYRPFPGLAGRLTPELEKQPKLTTGPGFQRVSECRPEYRVRFDDELAVFCSACSVT